ncbi:hypothetical protein SAMN06295905_2546 [Devosia lucknowensis]|uniref:PilZ domain-containing protein n=1 Tax=Devosia lucknowensis TaxID=1096929 RepID=A0A1Y6GAZ9_9HYPH|nr:PilZ domain-containing protein [Devosia lucknowensis]SMQ85269.1 hypothetical protein SAMN06295905_2546 [Devosia lucknowensis]
MERRRHPREPVKILATAVDEDGLTRAPITITNINRWGARIRIAGTMLPPTFYVLFGNSLEPCEVIWRRGGEVGLIFAPTEFGPPLNR